MAAGADVARRVDLKLEVFEAPMLAEGLGVDVGGEQNLCAVAARSSRRARAAPHPRGVAVAGVVLGSLCDSVGVRGGGVVVAVNGATVSDPAALSAAVRSAVGHPLFVSVWRDPAAVCARVLLH